MNVAIIGTGYVGLTTGAALAYLGHRVVCVDRDREKIKRLRRGRSPIYETGIEDLLARGLDLEFFPEPSVVQDAELIIISVGTPSKENGEADTRYVEDAAREIARCLSAGRTYTFVIKSTVPIGTHRRVAHVVRREASANGLDFSVQLVSNPEFLREGMAVRDTLYPDRIIVGAETVEAVDALRRLYRPILEQTFPPPAFAPRPEGYELPPLITTDPTSAEMTKYAANAFLAAKISFINEIAGLCERVGADVTEVARGMGLDPRIGPRFLNAGLGWGGSCFPKDTSALVALAAQYDFPLSLVQAAREVNRRRPRDLLDRLQSELKVLRGRVVGILGLAFKPGTDDVRDAPAFALIELLLQRGAHVRAHDPVAMAEARPLLSAEVELVRDPYLLADGADAVVLATEWDEYRQIDLAELARRMHHPLLLDGRNAFRPDDARAAGLTYLGVGR